ncbi:hypothetical protein [Aestuariivirga sp.]|uniref:hypothetical protein n=1 Tax=Aestuariivirga sp. TaxID=2650926 RepID=UPI003918CC82
MEFLNENMQVIIAAAVVLVLIFILMAVWRSLSPRFGGGRRGQRLGVSEYYEMDKTRRLVLVRRDNVEHLVLIGGPQDVVIETNISQAAITAAYSPSPGSPEQPATRAPPRPPVFGDRKPPPFRPAEPAPPAAPVPQQKPREEPEL